MITIKSVTDAVLELTGIPGVLRPGESLIVPSVTPDLARAIGLGLIEAPSGAAAPTGPPPVIFKHYYPKALPISSSRAYYVRVLRSAGGFNDGSAMRDFVAYYGDGAGMSIAFSDDGMAWDAEKKVSGLAANGYHVVCVLETPERLRALYWDPDVANQPYNMAGLRAAVCNPLDDPSAFYDDLSCSGDLVTEGSEPVWNRGHYGPSFLWYNPEPTSIPGKPFTWRYAMYFIASTGGNDCLGLGYSDDAINWNLYGDAPILSGLIDPQSWEGANGYISACHVERLEDGRWWMLYSGGGGGNKGIGYAWSWDRIHWTKAHFNPVFQAGMGPFLQRCYTPSLVQDEDGSFLLYRAGRSGSDYETFVARLRAQRLDWTDLLAPSRLGQGLSPQAKVLRGQGATAERDAAIPTPALGDEWFNTDLPDGGAWQKFTGAEWK